MMHNQIFNTKVALATGGGFGIGRATAIASKNGHSTEIRYGEEPTTNNRTMERTFLAIALALMCAISISAQTPPPTPANVSDECLLTTDADVWASIGLTTKQVEQVQGIQTNCKTACAATSETGVKDAAAGKATMKKHHRKIRQVLSKEQYIKWAAWCKDKAVRTEMMK